METIDAAKTWSSVMKRCAPFVTTVLGILICLVALAQSVEAKPSAQEGTGPSAGVAGNMLPAATNAPSSTLFTYQGQLLDANGNPITNSALPMTFKLYSVATGGTACWTEARSGANAVNVQTGQFQVLLGQITAIPASCVSGDAYLELTVNGQTLSPREILTSVAYALQAQTAQTVPDGSITPAKININSLLDLHGQSLTNVRSIVANSTGSFDLASGGSNNVWIKSFSTGGGVYIGAIGPGSVAVPLSVNGSGEFLAGMKVVGQSLFTRDNTSPYGNYTINLSEYTASTQKKANIGFHNSGVAEGYISLDGGGDGRKFVFGAEQGPMNGEFTGNLTTKGMFHLAGTDFIMDEYGGRGGGRAMVNDQNDTLTINYDGDFAGGVRLKGPVSCGALIESNLQTEAEQDAGQIDRFSEGDVLCWGADQLELCKSANDRLVQAVADKAGKPIVLGAEKVKVLGPVQRGDALVASDVPGYAMVNNDPRAGSVIAQALEAFDGKQGTIKAMISTLSVKFLHRKQQFQPAEGGCASFGMTWNSRSSSTNVATWRPKSVK